MARGAHLAVLVSRMCGRPRPVHLPPRQLTAVIDGLRDRDLIGDDGWLTGPGRAVKQRIEALTDDLAAKPYESLKPDEFDELLATLEPLATLLVAVQDW